MSVDTEQRYCLEDQVHDVISKSPYLTRRSVCCETNNGHVVLKGQVGTFFQKQMATEIMRQVKGVEQIDNRLEVIWS